MQAVIFEIFGFPSCRGGTRRWCTSAALRALKAKLALDESAEKEAAKASTKLTLRTGTVEEASLSLPLATARGPVV